MVFSVAKMNNDTFDDYIKTISLLGYKIVDNAVAVRYTYFKNGKPSLLNTTGQKRASIVMLYKNFKGSNIMTQNTVAPTLQAFRAKDGIMLREIATSPEADFDAITKLPEKLEEATSLKEVNEDLQVLRSNWQYNAIVKDCLKHNQVVLGNRDALSSEINNTMQLSKK